MIKMTEKEFKMMDLEFRTRASRLCRAKYQEVKMLLSKFIYHVENTPILDEYVQGCDPNMTDADIRAMTDRVVSGWGEVSFDFGNNTHEEVARQYRVLKYADECEGVERIFGIGRAFDHDTHYQSSVEGFVHGVVSPFVDNINLYLHSIAMNVCASPEKNITITASGDNTQINIANDNATQSATMTAHSEVRAGDWDSLKHALEELRIAQEDIESLRTAISREPPRSSKDLGGAVTGWIVKMVGKAAEKAIDIPFDVAASVLTTLVCGFCGCK